MFGSNQTEPILFYFYSAKNAEADNYIQPEYWTVEDLQKC